MFSVLQVIKSLTIKAITPINQWHPVGAQIYIEVEQKSIKEDKSIKFKNKIAQKPNEKYFC